LFLSKMVSEFLGFWFLARWHWFGISTSVIIFALIISFLAF